MNFDELYKLILEVQYKVNPRDKKIRAQQADAAKTRLTGK